MRLVENGKLGILWDDSLEQKLTSPAKVTNELNKLASGEIEPVKRDHNTVVEPADFKEFLESIRDRLVKEEEAKKAKIKAQKEAEAKSKLADEGLPTDADFKKADDVTKKLAEEIDLARAVSLTKQLLAYSKSLRDENERLKAKGNVVQYVVPESNLDEGAKELVEDIQEDDRPIQGPKTLEDALEDEEVADEAVDESVIQDSPVEDFEIRRFDGELDDVSDDDAVGSIKLDPAIGKAFKLIANRFDKVDEDGNNLNPSQVVLPILVRGLFGDTDEARAFVDDRPDTKAHFPNGLYDLVMDTLDEVDLDDSNDE